MGKQYGMAATRGSKYRTTTVNSASGPAGKLPQRPLRLLSFNIQAGIHTHNYHHYLTRGWQHLLPHPERNQNLNKIGLLLKDFDLIALQEVDGGSLRSGFTNQIAYLAAEAGLPFWHQQLNRNLGRLGQHSNGLLSRYLPWQLEDHKLPGLIPGRGAITACFGDKSNPLIVVVLHLALSHRGRNIQLEYVRQIIEDYEHVVVMGDMNTHMDALLYDSPLRYTNLRPALEGQRTYPSWRPRKSLDHILVSPSLRVHRASVLSAVISDHLPLAVEIDLPETMLIN